MGSPFGNPPPPRSGEAGSDPHGSGEAGSNPHGSGEAGDRTGQTPETAERAVSAAQQRFLSCRWRKPAENGLPDHCGHRDVLPMAGATGFAPDAWCPDCEYFKAKRTPRKREEIDKDRDRDRDWRW